MTDILGCVGDGYLGRQVGETGKAARHNICEAAVEKLRVGGDHGS